MSISKSNSYMRADNSTSDQTSPAQPHNIRALCITDSGNGFDVEEAKLKGRLGLISMEERLRLANGTIEIRSKPMRGTQIEARIPLA